MLKANVLIVDDEHIEREGMRAIIERAYPDLTIELAKHGQAAVDMVPQFQPDLIIMDIKMPVMNGLEAIEVISAQYPDITFIMVTAYDTFEYARQAIKLGVKDYILKPSKIAEIQNTVGEVIQHIHQQRLERQRQLDLHNKLTRVLPVVEADVVTQLLFDHVHEVHLDEMIALLEQTMKWNSQVFVFVIRIHPASFTAELYRTVKKKFRKLGNGLVGAMTGSCLPIIGFLEPDRFFRSQVASIIHELKSIPELCLNSEHNCIGVGNPRQSLDEVRYSFQEGMLAAAVGSQGAQYCFFADRAAGENKAYVQLWNKQQEKAMMEHLRLGQWNQVTAVLLQLVDQFEATQLSVHQAQQYMLEGLWAVFSGMSDIGIETELPFFPYHIHGYSELRLETERMLLSMRNDAELFRKRLQPDIIQKIKVFVESNSHRDISLELIAEEAGLSPFYISKLFKEHIGIGYIDYLTECRIERAKKMMSSHIYSLKEIAYEVGFNDPNYFSKVFKKSCGISPTDYRKALLDASQ